MEQESGRDNANLFCTQAVRMEIGRPSSAMRFRARHLLEPADSRLGPSPFHRPGRLLPDRSAIAEAKTEKGADVDPLMLHIAAALAENKRFMICERPRAALTARKGQGTLLGSRTNLAEVGAVRAKNAQRFAENVAPVVQQVRAGDVVSLQDFAAELDNRRVCSARGEWWPQSRLRQSWPAPKRRAQAWPQVFPTNSMDNCRGPAPPLSHAAFDGDTILAPDQRHAPEPLDLECQATEAPPVAFDSAMIPSGLRSGR